ncbi:MAG: 3-phosphoshikimate 1-carboxyvinyltransferase [Pirellulales bacterium]
MPSKADQIEIEPTGPLVGSVRPPGSKSLTNRALVCAALAEGDSTLHGALDSEDTQVMVEGLRRLGFGVDSDRSSGRIVVRGAAGRVPAKGADLYVANSGTTIRFLAALTTLGHGTFRLDGTPRMRQRPIGDLIEALRQLGADAASEHDNGCPPVIIRARGLPGVKATVRGDVSSQFLSGLLMAAPFAEEPVELSVKGDLVSKPYIRMTLEVMAAFGVEVERLGDQRFKLPAGAAYRACEYQIEPDASAASYFFAAAAISGGRVTVEGLSRDSVQGDVAFVDLLQRMGCQALFEHDRITVAAGPLKGIEADMNAISDTVQTLAAVALFADGPTTIRGVAHIRHKETDRIGALAAELRRLGAYVDERADGLCIEPAALHGATIETYQDHRMAMSLALVGLKTPGVIIRDPACTAKTYPKFFEDLAGLAGQ